MADPDPRFEREHGCTLDEWLRCLPGAVRGAGLRLQAQSATIEIGRGLLQLHWQVLAQRQIALVRLPRLRVVYQFDGVDAATRAAFMRYFDLFMQRGGG